MKTSITRSKWFLELLLVLVTLFWGLSYIWVKQITDAGLNVNAFASIRYIIATCCMLPLTLREVKQATKTDWKNGFIIGGLLYGALFFQTTGLNYTTPASSAFITTAYVVMVPFVMWVLMKKRPEKQILFAILICVVGLYFLNMQPGQGLTLNFGNVLTLVCALCWALQVTYISVAGQQTGTKLLAFLPLVTGAIFATVASLLTGAYAGVAEILPKTWLPVVLCALMPSVACGLLQSYVQKYLDPANAAVIYTLESVITCVVSILMGFEQFSLRLVLGGGLIIGAVLLAQLPLPGKQKKEKETT
ncbi:MAG: DMT family transporter [Clostridia bacterium]|nr:DMT family transporter [Clostridia bacterium]